MFSIIYYITKYAQHRIHVMVDSCKSHVHKCVDLTRICIPSRREGMDAIIQEEEDWAKWLLLCYNMKMVEGYETSYWLRRPGWLFSAKTSISCTHWEEPSQTNVILQQKLPAVKLSSVCTVYKQWLPTSGCNCGLRTTVQTQDIMP